MQQVNIHDAKTRLSRLIEQVESGEEFIIARNGKPVARLIKYQRAAIPRKPGGWEGRVWMANDFDETPEGIIEGFYAGQ